MPRPSGFVDAGEIARILDVEREYVYKLVKAGRIPALNVGKGSVRRTLRFDVDAVVAALGDSDAPRAAAQ